ncbi:potassium-transporting ATPase subunit KdpA [Thermus sp. FJN-A]
MNPEGFLQIALFFGLLLALAYPLGLHVHRLWAGERSFLTPLLGPLERLLYRLGGVDPQEEMDARGYGKALLLFNGIGLLFLYLLLRGQKALPLNPLGFPGMPPDLAFNTAASYVTNTNWQFYGGENTLGYLAQMLGLAVQNFLSAATGIAVAFALMRGLVRSGTRSLGNAYADLIRTTLYLLLPLALVLSLLLVSQGVPQTLSPPVRANLLDPSLPRQEVTIPLGPVASQVAIKHLGTNGGGFYGANTAHPFEGPTPLADLLEILAETLIPTALFFAFGRTVGDMRQGLVLLGVALAFWVPATLGIYALEARPNPHLVGVDQSPGQLEGKELRFGLARTAIFAAATTGTSTGAVDAAHDSLSPLGGGLALFLMMLGEVSPGGVGSGLYGLLLYALLAVFLAGLMVGRTPEYLGKKVGPRETKLAAFGLLVTPLLVLGSTAWGAAYGASQVGNPGPHGFSEILYAFASMANNNGSAFAGLAPNPAYAYLGGLVMLLGRFWVIVPVLFLAEALAEGRRVAKSAGTLPTHGLLFGLWLFLVVLFFGALNFFPALALGPLADHLRLYGGW